MNPAYWTIVHEQVDWDGHITGWKKSETIIQDYEGSVSIMKLPIHPIEFNTERESITQLALARGRTFESLRGFYVKTCKGSKSVYKLDRVRKGMQRLEKPVSIDEWLHSFQLLMPFRRSLVALSLTLTHTTSSRGTPKMPCHLQH